MQLYHLLWKQEKEEAIVQVNIQYDPFPLFRGMSRFSEKVKGTIVEGNRLYDLNYLKDTFNFCISHRLSKLFRNQSISGWSSYEVQIENEETVRHGFQVTGFCGNLIVPSSGWVKGFSFDLKTLDGSDFFAPPDRGPLFFTEKVVDLIRQNKVTNFGYAKIEDTKWYA